MQDIAANLEMVRNRIAAAEQRYRRQPGSVRLLAVSKTRSEAEIRTALASGQLDIGENYLQEAVAKMSSLGEAAICWHFIGPIQANKTRAIAEKFDWVHSLDRIKIARRLNDMRPDGLPGLNVCIELNIDNEPSKSGILPAQLSDFAAEFQAFPRLRLRGLMAMPRPSNDFEQQRDAFHRLYECYRRLKSEGLPVDTLSMGTTNDMEAAIAEGSTMVRIGTAIFGPRP